MKTFTGTADSNSYNQPKRGWACLNADVVAAYVDQTIGDKGRAQVERHLAACAYCRNLVADTVKLERVRDLPTVPAALFARVRGLGSAAQPKGWAWGLPMAAAGSLACLLVAVALLETKQSPNLPSRPAPAGPEIFKSQPQTPLVTEPHEVVRGSGSLQQMPTVTYPARDTVVSPDPLEIRWTAVPHAIYYQVRVLTSAGELVWQSEPTTNAVKTPVLGSGKYFVMVSAVMENGRMRKSDPRSFEVGSAP
jgi:hypothetical protein